MPCGQALMRAGRTGLRRTGQAPFVWSLALWAGTLLLCQLCFPFFELTVISLPCWRAGGSETADCADFRLFKVIGQYHE